METYMSVKIVWIFDFHGLSSKVWNNLKPTIFSEINGVLTLNRTSASPPCWPTGRDLEANGTVDTLKSSRVFSYWWFWSEGIQLYSWKASGVLIPRQDCQLPRGRFSRLLGNAGQLETETELILILGKDHMTSRFVLARWSVRCR